MNSNCWCVIKYSVLVYSGLCWVLNKICRFKCGNNTKTETALKKNSILGLGSYQNRSKKHTFGLGCNPNRGQKGIELKKREAHMASGAAKIEVKKGIEFIKKRKKHIWPRVEPKPRPKGRALWAWVPLNRGRRGLYGFGS